jgi:hypothetical protein
MVTTRSAARKVDIPHPMNQTDSDTGWEDEILGVPVTTGSGSVTGDVEDIDARLPNETDISVGAKLDHDIAVEVHTEIMEILGIEDFPELWKDLEANTLLGLDTFIEQPSRMYQLINAHILRYEPSFPMVPYYNQSSNGTSTESYIADGDQIINIVLDLKFMKDMIKMNINCDIMDLVNTTVAYDLNRFKVYKDMLLRKGVTWRANIRKYIENDEIASQYVSLDAETVTYAQDEQITLSSVMDGESNVRHIPPTAGYRSRIQHPTSINIITGAQSPNAGRMTIGNTMLGMTPRFEAEGGRRPVVHMGGRGFGVLSNVARTPELSFGRGGGRTSPPRSNEMVLSDLVRTELDKYNQKFVTPPTRPTDKPPIPGNILLGPPTTLSHPVTTVYLEEDDVYYPTVAMETVQSLSPAQTDLMFDNLNQIYASTSGGTLIPSHIPVQEAETIYGILQNYGKDYLDCYGWQNDPSKNPLVFDNRFLVDLFEKLSRAKRDRLQIRGTLRQNTATICSDSTPTRHNLGMNMNGTHTSSYHNAHSQHVPVLEGINSTQLELAERTAYRREWLDPEAPAVTRARTAAPIHPTRLPNSPPSAVSPVTDSGLTSSTSSGINQTSDSHSSEQARMSTKFVGIGEYRTPVGPTGADSMNTEQLMDIDFNQADTLVYPSSTWKPKTRTLLNPKVTWNGKQETFFTFSQQLAGWARMSGIGYMFNPPFRQDYYDGGWEAVARSILPVICHKQFNYDLDHLYGALQVACASAENVRDLVQFYQQRNNVAAHIAPANGLALYNAISRRHGVESNIRSLIDTALSDLQHLAYDKRHGTQTYKEVAETYLDLYHRMAGYDPGQIYHTIPSNWQRINGLGKILMVDPDLKSWVYTQTKYAFDNPTYTLEAFVQEIINYYDGTTLPIIHGRTTKDTYAHLGYTEDQQTIADSLDIPVEAYAALVSTNPRGFVLAPDAYKTLVDLGCAEQFLLARAKKVRELKDTSQTNNLPPPDPGQANPTGRVPYPNPRYPPRGPPTTTPMVPPPAVAAAEHPPLPKQYNKPIEAHGNITSTDVEAFAQSLQDQMYEDTYSDDDWNGTCHGGIVITEHTDESQALKAIISDPYPQGDSVVDSGADTMMLGLGWRFTEYQEGRLVNVRGFDAHSSKRQGLRIGTAVTVMYDNNHTARLVIAHEAVDNSPNKTSLLSVGQMQFNKLRIDTTRTRDGGNQHIHDTESGVILPLTFRKGMYRLVNRTPTSHEIATLPRIYLTSKEHWTPHCNDDDETPPIPPLLTQDQVTYHSQPTCKSENSNMTREGHLAHDQLISPTEKNTIVKQGPDSVANQTKKCSNVSPVPQSIITGPMDTLSHLGQYSVGEALYLEQRLNQIKSPCAHADVTTTVPSTHGGSPADTVLGSSWTMAKALIFTTTPTTPDLRKLQPYLAYKPIEVIRETLARTTQLARLQQSGNLRRHIQSRFPGLNKKRIHETIATDTAFSSKRDVSGALCAQVFFGINSHMMDIYPLRTESDGPNAFEDFVRQQGIPTAFRSDNSKMQTLGLKLKNKLRDMLVGLETTEPHHPQQNPCEMRAIRWLKENSRLIRKRTGAPSNVWYYIMKYLADVHNHTADETIGWDTPIKKRTGETPDISALLQFRFYEKIYYHDPTQSFPGTKEKCGYWLGLAHHVGDSLCYNILTCDTHKVIQRSVVRSVDKDRSLNNEARFPLDAFHPTLPDTAAPTELPL